MHKALRQRQPAADLAEQRIVRHEHIRKADSRVIGRHVEGPHILLDLHAGRFGRHQETGDAARIAVIAAGAGEQRAMGGDMHAGGPHLLAVDHPSLDAVAGRLHRAGFHMGRIRAMLGLGEAKGDAVFSDQRSLDHRLLVVAAVAVEHGDEREIADDRVLVLQVVVQAKSLGREMLADHGHPEIGAIPAAITLRDGKAQMPRPVGDIFHPAQQQFPLMPRQPAIFEIGARPFAPMIEEADVVVSLLDRLDLARDEFVQLVEVGDQVGRQGKIQGSSPRCVFLSLSRDQSKKPAPFH